MEARDQDLLYEIDRTRPICIDAADCEEKWNAARTFLLKKVGFKLQIYSADYMETYNPTRGSSVELAARVNKEPIGGGRYRIVGSFYCENMFGCTESAGDVMLNFNRYVAGFGANPATEGRIIWQKQ